MVVVDTGMGMCFAPMWCISGKVGLRRFQFSGWILLLWWFCW